MTTDEMPDDGTFTAKPVRLPAGVSITFEGLRISVDEQPGVPLKEQPGYWSETFTTVTVLPGAVLDHVAGSVTINGDGELTGINQAQAIPLLRQMLVDSDLPRFQKLIGDKDRVVDLGTLWKGAMYGVAKLTGRPTGGSTI